MQATGGHLRNVGPYAVERVIGRGGTGTVLLARDPKLGRQVAVKLLTVADAEATARMRAEAQLMGGFAQPHLLPILDVGEDPNGLYLVMPYMGGGSVDRLVARNGPLPAGQASAILVAVAEALVAMHTHGVVHRDVKPTNVFLSTDGDVFLGDLGLAWALASERLTVAGSFSGTLGYTAPEVANGADPTPLSDVFSLGVLGYYILAGVGPFDGSNPAAVIARLVQGTWTPLLQVRPDLDPAVAVLVEQAMAPDPGRRAQDLRGWAAQLRLSAPPQAIALPPPDPQLSAPDAAPSMRRCVACGAEGSVLEVFCGSCGASTMAQQLPQPEQIVVPDAYMPSPPTITRATPATGPPVPATAMHGPVRAGPATVPSRDRGRTLKWAVAGAAVACLGVLVMVLVLLARSDGSTTTSTEPAAAGPKTAGMASYATDGHFGFTATDFNCGVAIGSLAPAGKFCQVGLTVRNVDDAAPHTFLPAVQELAVGGTTLQPNTAATQQAYTANGGHDVSIAGGQEVRTVLVYDTAADADPSSMRLTVHESQGSPGVTIALAPTASTPGAPAPGSPAPAPPGVSSCAELQAQGMRYPDVVTYFQQHNGPSSMMTAAGKPCGDVYSYDEVVFDDPAKDKVGRCADLRALHATYPEAYNAWLSQFDRQTRSLMDLHGDGVPCGSKYPYDAVAAFLSSRPG